MNAPDEVRTGMKKIEARRRAELLEILDTKGHLPPSEWWRVGASLHAGADARAGRAARQGGKDAAKARRRDGKLDERDERIRSAYAAHARAHPDWKLWRIATKIATDSTIKPKITPRQVVRILKLKT